ncbi:hypothetical protein D9M70_421420 [compost metagenome]
MQADDLGKLVALKRNLHIRFVADGKANDEVGAADLPDPCQDFARHPRAIFKRTAPLIITPIAPGGPELIHHAKIGRPHFDAVEAGVPTSPCRLDETVDRLKDFGLGHRMRAVAVVIAGPARRRPVRMK